MPHLVQVQELFSEHPFTIVGITDARRADVESFIAEHRINFPVLAEAETDRENHGVRLIWGSIAFLVDPQGNVVAQGLERCEERLLEAFPPDA